MDNPSSLTFFLFCFCWVALIAGAVLGYIIGIRMARNRERHRLVKEKIRKNKVAIYHYQKEKYDYIEQINRAGTGFTEPDGRIGALQGTCQ